MATNENLSDEAKEVLTHLAAAANTISERFPASREASITRTKIEEAVLWLSTCSVWERGTDPTENP